MKMLLLAGGAVAIACGGGPTGQAVAPARPCPSAAPAGEGARGVPAPATGLDVLRIPPGFRPEMVEAEIERFMKATDVGSIPATPSYGAPLPPFLTLDPRRVRMSVSDLLHLVFETEPGEGHPGRKAQVFDEVFAAPPRAVLQPDGTLEVTFTTLDRAVGANVYYGTVPLEGALALPRYRRQVRANTDASGLSHAARIPAMSLLETKLDVAGIRASGRGLVSWQVEVLDPGTAAARSLDGATAFRCDPKPCGEGARFVQLPTQWRRPVVNLVAATSAVLTFSTDVPTSATVLVQGEGEDLKRFQGAAPGLRHEVQLQGLSPRTRYRYVALTMDARGEVSVSRGATFETAPRAYDAESAVSFVVLGDSRSGVGSGDDHYVGTNRRVLSELLVRALAMTPGFVLFNGDLADGYTSEPGSFRHGLEAWQESAAPVGAYVPIYELFGNHEALVEAWERGWAIGRTGADSAESIFADVFTNPRNGPSASPGAPPLLETVYSFDHGPVHVTVVNSNYWWRSHPHRPDHPGAGKGQREGFVDDRTLQWLDLDLGAARRNGALHLVLCTHEPPFPAGGHAADGMYWDGLVPELLARRDALLRLASQHGVRLLFAGDEHNYSRLSVTSTLVPGLAAPMVQVVSGGAGAPFYARDTGVPWADAVERFDVRQHFVKVVAEGRRLAVEAVAITGERIDQFEVDAR